MDDTVKLVWVTPGADDLVAYMARVSAPANQANTETAPRLISYLIRNAHWSPFQMVNMCVEVNAPRDISRQILRHTSVHMADVPDFVGVQEFDGVQEFSQRYANVSALPPSPLREARLQDAKNRQNSVATDDASLQAWWKLAQEQVLTLSGTLYDEALERGVAKEVARVVLPEGLTPSRLYLNGTLRSWLHFFTVRSAAHGAQKEATQISQRCEEIANGACPAIMEAWRLTQGC